MESKRMKRALYGALMAIGVIAGAAGIANAVTSPTTTKPAAANADTPESGDTQDATADTPETADAADLGADIQEPTYQSSVTVPGNATDRAGEAQEAQALSKLATITPQEASDAALAAVPGTVTGVQLEDENGNVVYSVVINTGSGSVDVKIDAGNAKVLRQEPDGAETAG